MTNDLLFPILPRDGKVPVNADERVKKVSKGTNTKGLGEEERFEHDDERRVARQQEREAHEQHAGEKQDKQEKGNPAEPGSEKTADKSGLEPKGKGGKHLDIYI
ncbi:hypothetical protein [Aestuariibacter sp. A3R04]|uniref:hypothetical protein n=1 Tax=Aestuariibacter sp. A3R04 TaxID=2841571 RepID=UPI001C08B5EB|nr:hypothetical protein [Aestuariibacter sp. A3R04]MBU3023350.1 hypothetical protein [Aestuariibacter sp. A3R04]